MGIALVPRKRGVLDAISDPHVRQGPGAKVDDPADSIVGKKIQILLECRLPLS